VSIDLVPYIPVLIQLVILAGTIYVARSARPKLVAETKQVEAEAAHTLVNGFSSLVVSLQTKLAEAEAELKEEKKKAGVVPTLARRIDELEAELKAARSTISDLEHDT